MKNKLLLLAMTVGMKSKHRNRPTLIFIITFFLFFVISGPISFVTYNLYAISENNNSNVKQLSPLAGAHDRLNRTEMNDTIMKMTQRGNVAMGFNQNKITHQFIPTPFGGEIIITALNASDKETINLIKNHVSEIQKEFSQGNFTRPFFIHAQQVPGTEVMYEKKDLIEYNILEMKTGSSLVLTTNDTQLVDAINQFMEFQAKQHYGH
jgi:hypothetical protein